MVIDSGPGVLVGVDPHAQSQHEPSFGQMLERGDLFGHRGGLAQWELKDAAAQGQALGGSGGDGQRGEALVDGMGPEEVVHRPQRVRSGGLDAPAELGQGTGAGPGSTCSTTIFSWEFPLHGGGEDQSEGRTMRSVSYRRHTDMLRIGRGAAHLGHHDPATAPWAPPGAPRRPGCSGPGR